MSTEPAVRAPIEVEVVECVACDRAYQPPRELDAECCDSCLPAPSVTTHATLAPGSLDEALHRLGLASEALAIATLEWVRGGKRLGSPLDIAWNAAADRHTAAMDEVRRLREAR